MTIRRFVTLAVGVLALLTCAFAITAQAQQSGKITADVQFERAGPSAFSSVKVALYEVKDCCDDCLPNKCTKLCCPIAKLGAPVDFKILTRPGKITFEDVKPGRYLVTNEADRKPAGYENVIQVGEKEKVDLGPLVMDRGQAYHRRPPVE